MACNSTAKVNLCIGQGETFKKQLVWKTGTPPLPVNLVGWKARMQVRESYDSDEILIELSTEPISGVAHPIGTIALDEPNGMIELSISADTTALLSFESAIYDLEMVSPSGNVTLSREVTR